MSRVHCREIAEYVRRLHAGTEPESAIGRKLTAWIREHDSVLGVDFAAATSRPGARKRAPAADDTKPLTRTAWRRIGAALAAPVMAEHDAAGVSRNARTLAEALRLSPDEANTFAFVAMTTHEPALEGLCNRLSETRVLSAADIIGLCIGMPGRDVAAALGGPGLTGFGLIDGSEDCPGRFDLYLPYDILKALRPPSASMADIERSLVGTPSDPRLSHASFDYVAAERDFIARLLAGATGKGTPGVNVLLYGAPGTGKTELARIVAHAAGCALFPVGEARDDGYEMQRHHRLSALRLADRLLKPRRHACLLFDEMEDILQGGTATYTGGRRVLRAGSKVHFNRMLESNALPVIWTANAIDEIDPAFLRRMSFVVHMKVPPRAVREQQWLKMAHRHGLALAPETASDLAYAHPVAPSAAESAVASVALAGGDTAQLGLVAGNLARMARRGRASRTRLAAAPDIDLFNADLDLAGFERALEHSPVKSVAFCLHGPAGTGKTAYARRIADRYALEPMEMRGSDFLSKWVGETEQNIAHAFEDAAAAPAMLIVDEAETMFWDRGKSERSWESSQVNEFLAALETHPLPVAFTTNHMERIDAAIIRRLTFKVKFDLLTPEQRSTAFQRFFGGDVPARVRDLEGLALGDLVTARKKANVLRIAHADANAIVGLLEAELAVKPHAARRIGF